MRLIRTISCFILFCISPFSAIAQEGDMWNVSLDSIVVQSHHYSSAIKTGLDGTIKWDLSQMKSLPKLLGEADPLRYAQLLPGIQTNDEYHSGIHVQGCDNQHNMVSIGGVPLYNVGHLLGFFSTFISSHFPSMTLSKSPPSAGMTNRIGAELIMDLPDEPVDSSDCYLSLGLIASQGTFRLAMGKRTTLTVSSRLSYMKYLYSSWLKTDDHQFDYSFYDANVTLAHRVNDSNRLVFDFYSGNDHGGLEESNYLADMDARWGNLMGAAHWLYDGRNSMNATATLYVTSYRNRFTLTLQDMWFDLQSHITDAGVKGQVSWRHWNSGIEAIHHWIRPQSLTRRGGYNETSGEVATDKSVEASLFVNYSRPIVSHIAALAGLRGSLYAIGHEVKNAIDPLIQVSYDDLTTQVSLSCARKRQYLFQTGFSDMGLPTEFWMSCNDRISPQSATLWSLSASRYLLNRAYRVTVDLFYKKLSHQVEYFGNVLDFMNKDYDIAKSVIPGNGENYGFSVLLNKNSGRLNGWISYSYLHAVRSFTKLSEAGTFPANHSRPHELNLMLTYSCNRHWDFGASAVMASGTPYTGAEAVYVQNGNLIVKYGEHNGKRLRHYMRADVSVNYKWSSRVFKEHCLNFSLYNVTNHANELFHYLRTNKDGMFAYRPIKSVMRLLPSISYSCKF